VSDFREKIATEKIRYTEELSEIDPKLKKYETTKEKNERHIGKLQDLAAIYEQYLAKCRELGVYDFADMIRFVLEEFRRDENLCYMLAERYQFVMIDEFQDTNNAQNEILERIVAPNDSRNILVVGDDDQSIYRFQ
jgi:DNA helicase-2/ATP-dependent DNA helicase PcrA